MLVVFLPYCLQAISSSGANSSQGKKIYHWVSVGKGHGWIWRVMKQALRNEMELYWLLCIDSVRGLQPESEME